MPEPLLVLVATGVHTSAGPSLYKVIGNVPLAKFAVSEIFCPSVKMAGFSVRFATSGPVGATGGGGTGVTTSGAVSTAGLLPEAGAWTR